MYKFNLSSCLRTVYDIHKSEGLPVVWGRHVLAGTLQNEHKYKIQIVHLQNLLYRVTLVSDRYVVAMYQDSEPTHIQYILDTSLVSTGVKISSTEEELFQQSLVDNKICTYEDLQILIELLQYGMDVMSNYNDIPRKQLC